MKVKELIDFIGENNFHSQWESEKSIEGRFGTFTKVAEGLEFDEHRWFSISTDMYQCEDGYVGVTAPSQLKSEMMSWEDTCETATASEYEVVQTVTYKRKK